MPEEIIGRESPPPERQSDKQQHAPTGSGSTDGPKDPDAKVKQLKEEINNLESNPKEPFADVLEQKFSKGPGN